jgi:hypothetical protein
MPTTPDNRAFDLILLSASPFAWYNPRRLSDLLDQIEIKDEIEIVSVREVPEKVRARIGDRGFIRSLALVGHLSQSRDALRVGLEQVTAENATQALAPLAQVQRALLPGETVVTICGCGAGKRQGLIQAFSRVLPGALIRASEGDVRVDAHDFSYRGSFPYPRLWEDLNGGRRQPGRILHCEGGTCTWKTREEDQAVLLCRYWKRGSLNPDGQPATESPERYMPNTCK